ncbi:MAG: hypothetical protein IJO63_01205 [Bacilli bacterium]|nr:hypothetical protein [Bacilli bacterium]
MNSEQNNLNQTPSDSLNQSPVTPALTVEPPIQPGVTPALTETTPVAPVTIEPVTPASIETPVVPAEPIAPVVEPVAPVMPDAPVAPVVAPVMEVVPVAEPVMPAVELVQPVLSTPVPEAEPAALAAPEAVAAPVAPSPVAEPPVDTFTAVSTPMQPTPVEEPVAPAAPVAPTLSVDPMLANNLSQPSAAPTPQATPKKKSSKKGLIIGLLVAVVIAVAAFFGLKFFMVTPQKVYTTFISETFAQGKKLLGFDQDLNKSMVYSGNIVLETNIEGLEDLNKYSYDYLMGLDIPNKKMELKVGLNEDNKELLSGFMYILDTNAYLNSSELYDKIISLGEIPEFDWDSLLNTNSLEEVEYLYDKLSVALQNAIPEEEIKSESTTISINGKDTKVTENYFELTAKNINIVIERLINTFKNDDKALEILARYAGIDKEQLKIQLDSAITSLKVDTSADGTVRVSLFTKGKTTLAGYSVKVTADGETLEVVRGAFEDGVGQVVIGLADTNLTIDLNKDTYSYTFNNNGLAIFSGTLKVTENEAEFVITVEGMTFKFSTKVNESNDNLVSTTTVVELTMDEYNAKVTLNGKLEYGASVASVDVSSAQPIEELDEYDLEEIEEKLMDILEDTALYELFEEYSDSLYEDSYYDDDYYEDYYEDDYYDDEFNSSFDDYF